MNVYATQTLWRVHVEAGSWREQRVGEWIFNTEWMAKEFAEAVKKHVEHPVDVGIEEIKAYTSVGGALEESWPFPELRRINA